MTQLDPIVVFLQIWENAHILVFSPILEMWVSMMAEWWIVGIQSNSEGFDYFFIIEAL
jgi:hypothetical protein